MDFVIIYHLVHILYIASNDDLTAKEASAFTLVSVPPGTVKDRRIKYPHNIFPHPVIGQF